MTSLGSGVLMDIANTADSSTTTSTLLCDSGGRPKGSLMEAKKLLKREKRMLDLKFLSA